MFKNSIIVTYSKVSRRGKPGIVSIYQDGDARTEEIIKVLYIAAQALEAKLKDNGPERRS